ncbi:hypothetical protein [Levyella massiliensis]|uniref:hypothetical protein n=1 Tax=Levyella massiliensis TaxID=938289 RepID=UPI0024AE4340|nr:hypothetical protein [Levyella massiliensis]
MKTKRNNILYYASTALIIETAISLGFALLVSLFGGIAASWINRGNDVSGYFLGVLGFSIFFLALLAIVLSLAYFYAGFAGRKNADNPQAGSRLFIFGIIMLVISAISILMKFTFLSLIHLVIVALYAVGAYELKTGKMLLSQYLGQAPKVDMNKNDMDKVDMDQVVVVKDDVDNDDMDKVDMNKVEVDKVDMDKEQ